METTPREVWLQRIEAWKQSGLTAKAFAERNGFNLKTFENRKYHLRRQARRQASLVKRDVSMGTGFVELVDSKRLGRAAKVVATPVGAKSVDAPFEVQLRNGVTVRIPPRFDARALNQLLTALEAC
jgi:predicted phosphoribosyltransferase